MREIPITSPASNAALEPGLGLALCLPAGHYRPSGYRLPEAKVAEQPLCSVQLLWGNKQEGKDQHLGLNYGIHPEAISQKRLAKLSMNGYQ